MREKKKKKTWTSGLASSPGEGLRGSLGEKELSQYRGQYPRGRSWVQQTLVPSADLGRVHVNNKLWPQGFSATPQATLPVGNFALRSSSPGQRMVEASRDGCTSLPYLQIGGPIRAQAISSFHLSSFNWKVGMATAPSQGILWGLNELIQRKHFWTKCGMW